MISSNIYFTSSINRKVLLFIVCCVVCGSSFADEAVDNTIILQDATAVATVLAMFGLGFIGGSR